MQNVVIKHLNDDSDLLINLSPDQLKFIPKFIVAIYLLNKSNKPILSNIIRISGLHHSFIDKMINIFDIKLPKQVKYRDENNYLDLVRQKIFLYMEHLYNSTTIIFQPTTDHINYIMCLLTDILANTTFN